MAGVRPPADPCVQVQFPVAGQPGCVEEATATDGARVRPLPRVHPLVQVEGVRVTEGPVARGAGEGLREGVRSLVLRHVALPMASVWAVDALEPPLRLLCMCTLHVLVKVVLRGEAVPAQ